MISEAAIKALSDCQDDSLPEQSSTIKAVRDVTIDALPDLMAYLNMDIDNSQPYENSVS